VTCPDCHGKGRIELFTSAKPCAKCGGSGKIAPSPTVTTEVSIGATITIEPGKSWSSPTWSKGSVYFS
jgi:DnaJ-class molecular chaperone